MASIFQQALAAQNTTSQPSGSSVSIRGQAASNGSASARIAGSALRQAGVIQNGGNGAGMEVDGGRPARGAARSNNSRHHGSSGPLDQSGRQRPGKASPYAKPPSDRDNARSNAQASGSRPSLASRLGNVAKPNLRTNLNNPQRLPAGTPPILKQSDREHRQAGEKSQHNLTAKLNSDDMKAWIIARHKAPGFVDMSDLPSDPWLREQGILPPGHRDAPVNAGLVFWKLIDRVIQQGQNQHVVTLSLANNGFTTLRQLAKLPISLPNLQALDLSNNPIHQIDSLNELLSQGEKKGKATAGNGSLKSLTELKLDGCPFRDEILATERGGDKYQHDILRRFPGLLMLDGVNLNRIVFDVRRKPRVRPSEAETKALTARPFTFPFDVQPSFFDNDGTRDVAMRFCARFYPLFDTDRPQLFNSYANNATISVSANIIPSRSYMTKNVKATQHLRPNPVGPEKFVPKMTSRNLLKTTTTAHARLVSLKSPMNNEDLLKFWRYSIPVTRHDLQDANKWLFDAWMIDEQRICIMVQGEFEEMPSGTFRSFSRTFILGPAPPGSPAQSSGWEVQILSDTMVATHYLSNGAWAEGTRSLAQHGITISPPIVETPQVSPQQQQLITEVRARTGMNDNYAILCLSGNDWDFERALRNFEELKATIPPDAYQ